jgi:putative CocE/NonD family hydrolase
VIALALLATLAAAPQPPSPPVYGVEMKGAWVPMPDGARLAADLFVPTGGRRGERFPVLLEYLPYRKTEDQADNWSFYSYFVTRGYVVARVDIRGTGNSEGRLIPYEYSEIEQEDGESVIDWLAKQPFSTGKVGMFGISWGGFNSIHMAMRRSPALKAIIAVDATDDLYQDDVHFMDGIIHVDSWEMGQDLRNMVPGAPDFVLDDAYFRDRFDTPPWMLTYKREQRDGPFWKRTALKERYDAIQIPTFVIGGWYDGYRDSVPRMLEHLKAPVKAMVGPWHHSYPHDGWPKPQMEWRHEAIRWYDQWLKGRNTGIMDEPRFAVFVRQYHPPDPKIEEVKGEWRWEDGWPIARIQNKALYPQPNHTLAAAVPAATTHSLRNVPTVGLEAGGPVMWWGDVPPDQTPTDAYSLVYDTDPLTEDLEILGLPLAQLRVSADAPLANWFARLNDVAPDGTVTQVAGAAQNGAHRKSAESPEPLVPGETFPLDIEMHFTSWVFPKGHRIRLAVNNAMWPMLWPSRYPVTTTLSLGGADGTRVQLPVVPPGARPKPSFLPPATDPKPPAFLEAPAPAHDEDDSTISGYGEISRVERDVATGTTKVIALNGGTSRFPWGTRRYEESITHTLSDLHPEAATVAGEYKYTLTLKDRVLVFESNVVFRSDTDNFYYQGFRRVSQDGKVLREKNWKDTIPRDFQ